MKNAYLFLMAAALALSYAFSAHACTIFRSPFAGDSQVAHNVDWYDQFPDVKGIIGLNPSGMHKKGILFGVPAKLAEWTSLWKSATFTIGGAEFPVSGFNEKGLFMGVLVLHEAKYPAVDDPRPAMGVTQFVQYNLDTSTTIEDVIASGQKVRPYAASFKMHYFACDASAKCAVLQYVNGALVTYKDADLPHDVLTNSLYPVSVAAAQSCSEQSCDQPNTSLWRFGQAVWQRNAMHSESFTENAFGILNRVAQKGGITTRFQLTYDPAHSRMNMRTGGQSEHAWVDVDFSKITCNSQVRKVIPITPELKGDVSGLWQDLTREMQY
ncbi:MAG: linear amide C-N hydrolase, partial [Bdellovibrionota bacterium]